MYLAAFVRDRGKKYLTQKYTMEEVFNVSHYVCYSVTRANHDATSSNDEWEKQRRFGRAKEKENDVQ